MAQPEAVLLSGCTVVDCAVAGRSTARSAILVRGERIEAVGPAAELEEQVRRRAGGKVRIEQLGGAFVVPGLWDAHVHLGDVVPPHAAAYAGELPGAHMIRCIRKAQDNLRAGITSVRSLGERFDHDVTLRDAIGAGVIEGPRVFASGDVAWSATAVGPEQFRREVRRMARLGVDQIKVLGSGGIPTRSRAGITTPFVGREELVVTCEEARRWGLPVVLHAMGDETVELGIELGVRSIEHAFAMSEALVPRLAASQTALCPNLVVTESWDPAWMASAGLPRWAGFPRWMVRNAAEAREHHHAVVGACIAAGVRMLAGADDLPEPDGPVGIERAAVQEARLTGQPGGESVGGSSGTPEGPGWTPGERPGWAPGERPSGKPGLVRELELLAELGLGTGLALRAATADAAWSVGREQDLGTIEEGKLADLVVLDGDPLANLAVLERPRQVLLGGRPISV